MLDACVSVPKPGTPETSIIPACTPWPCRPGQICAAHAPRISPADAAPLVAIFAQARTAPTAMTA